MPSQALNTDDGLPQRMIFSMGSQDRTPLQIPTSKDRVLPRADSDTGSEHLGGFVSVAPGIRGMFVTIDGGYQAALIRLPELTGARNLSSHFSPLDSVFLL